MANTRVFTQSFAGGEISPLMLGRIGDAKYESGAAKVRNMIATPQGPAEMRPGFAYVNSTKNNGVARLIPFIYATNQAMVVELGDHYARFHANGETLQYSTDDVPNWVAPSGDLSLTFTTPAKITWTAHGLATGDPIRFYVYDGTGNYQLPIGLRVGYSYTVQVIDANTFYILDNGALVALTAPSGGGGSSTNYPGTGSTSVSLLLAPNQSGSHTSLTLSGLASTVVSGGVATLNVSISANVYISQGGGAAVFEYCPDITATTPQWFSLYGLDFTSSQNISIPINVSNLDTLGLRIVASGGAGPSGSVNILGTINSWSVDVPTGGSGTSAALRAYYYYSAGQLVSYGGLIYYAVGPDGGGMATPGSDSGVWWDPEPGDLSYEIPTPWAVADVFDLHYAQSADVMTIVHPSYPPQLLSRLSATTWTCTPVQYTPTILPPDTVKIVASPGFTTAISSITLANPGVFTTSSNHNFVAGDGIYIANLTKVVGSVSTDISGFYLVNSIPLDGMGNYIPNELTVMDYSGNVIDSSGWSSWTGPASIQYGDKIYNIDNFYAVAAVSTDNINQSAISTPVDVINNLDVPGSYNTISWDAVVGAGRYEVYKKQNGLWGYIGETTDLSFVDNNIAPDMGTTPPNYETVFNAVNNYPAAVGYYQQRKGYGGTNAQPLNLWMSFAGTEDNFSYSLPTTDEDRIAIQMATVQRNAILHIVPLSQLMVLTDGSEIRVSPVNSDTLSPTTISALPQSYVGASNVTPAIVNNALLYCAARGGHMRELGYSWQANGFITGDISLRAAHLFDNLELLDMTFQKSPQPIAWVVSSSGKLLGLTYIPEEQVGAWHQHDTAGTFVSVCAIPEGSEDRVYAVIQRQVNGNTVCYVERMGSMLVMHTPTAEPADAFYVDAGTTFNGANTTATTIAVTVQAAPGGGSQYVMTASAPIFAYPATTDVGEFLKFTLPTPLTVPPTFPPAPPPTQQVVVGSVASTTVAYSVPFSVEPTPDPLNGLTTASWAWGRSTISGLSWLEGETLSVLGDGAVLPQVIVKAGSVTLQHAAVQVNLGLPFVADLETLPPTLQIDGFGHGRMKNINKAWIRVWRAGSILIGPNDCELTENKPRMWEGYGEPPALKSEDIDIFLTPEWQRDGTVHIQQTDPLPLAIVSLTLEVATGG